MSVPTENLREDGCAASGKKKAEKWDRIFLPAIFLPSRPLGEAAVPLCAEREDEPPIVVLRDESLEPRPLIAEDEIPSSQFTPNHHQFCQLPGSWGRELASQFVGLARAPDTVPAAATEPV